MFLASPRLELYRFSSHFADFEQFKVDIFYKLWASQNSPYSVLFTPFGQVTVILLRFGKTYREKRFKPSLFDKNSRTRAEDLA